MLAALSALGLIAVIGSITTDVTLHRSWTAGSLAQLAVAIGAAVLIVYFAADTAHRR